MRCANCGSDNPEGTKFCGECGGPIQTRCPQCSFENLPSTKFCRECGTPLTGQSSLRLQPQIPSPEPPQNYTPKHLAERILAEQTAMEARGSPAGERKTITALFADIKSSMALMEHLDPEEARSLIDPALTLMIEAVHRYEGYVVQSTGDGIFAFFGAPIAHEDHPQRALYAALRMQDESGKYADTLRRAGRSPIEVRIGVNTGEVVLRSIRKDDLRAEYTPIGHSTALAQRMESLARAGSIVVSDHTYKLTEGYFDFKPLGAATVKGVSEPISVYEVLCVGPLRTRLQVAATRGLVRFVGRQREMEHLKRALEEAKTGRGQIIGVMGEPGVGKSRLFHEFLRAYAQTPLLLCLETFSVSHSKAYPYLPLIDLLKNYFHIAPQDDERKRREKIGGKVLMLDRSLEDTLPYLFTLLGIAEPASSLQQMDPQIRKQRTFEAIKRLLVRESLNQPLLLLFEDLHWLDTETQAFLILLSESIATAKILLLTNYRPEYQQAWGNRSFFSQLRLDPLAQEDAQELLRALLGDDHALRSLKQFILEKTEGNPFFMEELVQALVEQGVLERSLSVGVGLRPAPTVNFAELRVPTTVQAVLASRIDRLPPAEKSLLQMLSVIGKEFSWSLLKQVVNQPEAELPHSLSHLQAAEFIYEQPAFPEVEYTFKHALTQEVAYNSLLIERRKVLHERTAQAIEMIFHSQLEDHYGDLAHHYHRSTNTEKAVEYLGLAGRQAAQRSANTDALTHLTTALELLKTLPETSGRAQQELTLLLALGSTLRASKGFAAPEVEMAYSRARVLCEQIGEIPQLFSTLRGLWGIYFARGQSPRTQELAVQLLQVAEHAQDPTLLPEAHHVMGMASFALGELTAARTHLEQGIALYDLHRQPSLSFLYPMDPGAAGRSWLSEILWYLGYPDQALKQSQEALALAYEIPHRLTLAGALSHAAALHRFRGELQLTQQHAETLRTLATEQGFSFYLEMPTVLQGWFMAEQGKTEEGVACLRQGMAALEATGGGSLYSPFPVLLAEAYNKAGRAEEGLSVVAEVLAEVHQDRSRHESELYRLKGELSLQSGVRSPESTVHSPESEVSNPQSLTPNPQAEADAEACFQKAIEIARKQSAKSLELRAVMSLSRLWQQQGKRQEAHMLLSEIYHWFTEGFETKDLQDAKALLEELAEGCS
ncbi:MAG: AAA family ATPase [Deltaproteobacteria bacterium]|nr:AAA family ATPase [Deltaproteobacteria bacterium]